MVNFGDSAEEVLCLHHVKGSDLHHVLCFQPLLGKCLFFLRTTEKAITTANVQQEVNFGVLDCSGGGGVLNSLETLLTHIMLPALRSQQVKHLHPFRLSLSTKREMF
ncbi:unnamed protein product [Oreochromis niloticus]|nr:unnamed protein product [Mustela putorius furo]